jgi:hypothetical protein
MCRLSRNPGALTSRTTQGHVGLFRGYFTFTFTFGTGNFQAGFDDRLQAESGWNGTSSVPMRDNMNIKTGCLFKNSIVSDAGRQWKITCCSEL